MSSDADPIAKRTRKHDIKPEPGERRTAAQAQSGFFSSMVKIDGLQGSMLVHRYWTEKDILEAASDLTDPRQVGGRKFGEEFENFCRSCRPTENEIKRILMRKLGSSYCKIDQGWTGNDTHLTNPEYTTGLDPNGNQAGRNGPYWIMIRDLRSRLEAAFPLQVNTEKIAACKLEDGETVQDYLVRLTRVHTDFSGLEGPQVRAADADHVSPWEAYLCNSFLLGLKPELSNAIKQHLVGYNRCPLSTIEDYAKHHEALLYDQAKRKEKKRADMLDQAIITLVGQVAALSVSVSRGRGRGRGQCRGRARSRGRGREFTGSGQAFQPGQQDKNAGWNNRCYNCGKHGHFARDCWITQEDEHMGQQQQ